MLVYESPNGQVRVLRPSQHWIVEIEQAAGEIYQWHRTFKCPFHALIVAIGLVDFLDDGTLSEMSRYPKVLHFAGCRIGSRAYLSYQDYGVDHDPGATAAVEDASGDRV